MRVFAYIRVSSDEQSRHGTSLDGQRSELEGYCAARRWPAPTIFREVESGAAEKLGARVELQRLIAEVRAGDVVLVAKTDRWSRDLVHGVASVRELTKRGVKWISIGEGIDASTSQGDATLGIMSWSADQERKRIRERTMGRRHALRDSGCWTESVAPFGYRRDPVTRHLTIVPDEAKFIRELFDAYIERASMEALAREWSLAKVRGHRWDKKAIHNILRARWYLGEIKRVDGTWAPAHEPIVTLDVFERAARVMKNRTRGGRPPGAEAKTASWLLRSIGVCPKCGSRMGAVYSPIANYYYACNGRRGKKDCDAPYVSVPWADAEANRLTLARLAELRELLANTNASKAPRRPDAARLESLKASLASARLRRTRTVTLAVEGVIQNDELRTRLGPIDAEIAALGASIDDEERRVQPLKPERRAEVLRDIGVVEQLWRNLPIARKRDIIMLMTSRIEISTEEIRLAWRSVAELSSATVGTSLLPTTVYTSEDR